MTVQKNDIDIYETYINHVTNNILIKKYGYNYPGDGSEILDDLDEA